MVTHKEIIRNGTVMEFVGVTMGKPDFAASVKNTIATWVQACLPKPAAIGLFLDALPKPFQWLKVPCAGVMTRDEAHWLPLNVSALSVGAFGKGGELPATTLTEARCCLSANAPAVSAYKAHGFAFDPAILTTGFRRDGGLSTATALAITVGNILRGIIEGHGNLPFLCLIRERFAVAARSFCVLYSFNYSTSEAI